VITFGSCEVADLRLIGLTTLATLLFVCYLLRSSLQPSQESVQKNKRASSGDRWDVAHVAFNICLFPPLFFFSGLYYTDVLSTLVVILAYYVFLQGSPSSNSTITGLATYALGIVALFMRQTNIFWVCIFLAGLEWVRTCKDISSSESPKQCEGRQGSWLQRAIIPYTRGQLHDPSLNQAGPVGRLHTFITTKL